MSACYNDTVFQCLMFSGWAVASAFGIVAWTSYSAAKANAKMADDIMEMVAHYLVEQPGPVALEQLTADANEMLAKGKGRQ